MGSQVCAAVRGEEELDLVAEVGRSDELERLTETQTQVAVEFTSPDSVKSNIDFCLDNEIHCVVGTTGLTADDLAEIGKRARDTRANVFVAPNFAVGAVLMMRFAAQAASYFGRAEIVERHHEKKLDAPSGTSLRTAELMNDARGKPWARPEERASDARGRDVEGVRIHSLRVPGSVAHQEVILGSTGETLTIKHDSLDRASFMPGVLLAIKNVSALDGLVVGLENLLDL